MEKKERKTSEAKLRANAKYDSKAYQKKLVRFKPAEWEKFRNYTKDNNYTDNGYIISAIMYCIDNNIQLK